VPDSIIAQLGIDKRDSLYVIYFDPSVAPPMRRAAAEYAHAPVKVIGPSDIPANINKTTLQQCAFLMKRDASVVMVDHMRRIRGQYDGSSRDDIDRLLVEIDIILKNY
jgi:hypothetical protein